MPSAHLTLREEDVVRLALEFLHNRDLHISQLAVERETGVINGEYGDDVLFLRQLVLDGQWDDALEFVQPLEALRAFDARRFAYLVLRAKYVELLCIKSEAAAQVNNVDSAVDEVVRVLSDLEKYAPSKDEYSNLCLLLTLPRLTDHLEYRDWNPSNARVRCFREIYPLVEKFLSGERGLPPTSGGGGESPRLIQHGQQAAKNDRLIQLIIKGVLYESCVNYCQAKATGGGTNSKVADQSTVTNGSAHDQDMSFSRLLDGSVGFSDSDLSLLSWLQSIPAETFGVPFEQRTLNVDVERLERPSLDASWTEHMLVAPIKPRAFPHSAMPFTRPRSAADAMTRSLMPGLDGLTFGLSGANPDVTNADMNHVNGDPMSRSSFASFHLTGVRNGKLMSSSVDRLFENEGDVFLSSSYADFQQLPSIQETAKSKSPEVNLSQASTPEHHIHQQTINGRESPSTATSTARSSRRDSLNDNNRMYAVPHQHQLQHANNAATITSLPNNMGQYATPQPINNTMPLIGAGNISLATQKTPRNTSPSRMQQHRHGMTSPLLGQQQTNIRNVTNHGSPTQSRAATGSPNNPGVRSGTTSPNQLCSNKPVVQMTPTTNGDAAGRNGELLREYQKQKQRAQEKDFREQQQKRQQQQQQQMDNRLQAAGECMARSPQPLCKLTVQDAASGARNGGSRVAPGPHSGAHGNGRSTTTPPDVGPYQTASNPYDKPLSQASGADPGTAAVIGGVSRPRFVAVTSLEDVQAVRCAEFHPNGRLYAVGSNSKTLRICAYPPLTDVREEHSTYQPTVLFKRTKHHKGSIYCLAWSPAGDLMATGSNDKTVKLMRFNADTSNLEGQEIELTMHDGTVRDLCFVEDATNKSSLLISGGAGDCKIYVTDCETGTPFQALSGHSGHVLSLYNWGGAMFASGSQDRTVRFWDLRTRGCVNTVTPVTQPANRGSPVAGLCVDPSGRLLVSGHEDSSCVLFDIRGGRPVQCFKPHSSDIRSIRFSPSAYYLLTGGYDNKLVLTDLQGDLTMPLPSVVVAQHNDKVISGRWHPSEFSFLSTSADKTATLWALPPI